ncbi:hypothetical protein LINPERHAP2_LOCUS18452, partial [Linum perenne]
MISVKSGMMLVHELCVSLRIVIDLAYSTWLMVGYRGWGECLGCWFCCIRSQGLCCSYKRNQNQHKASRGTRVN